MLEWVREHCCRGLVVVIVGTERERQRIEGELRRLGARAGQTRVWVAGEAKHRARGWRVYAAVADHHAYDVAPYETLDALDYMRDRGVWVP